MSKPVPIRFSETELGRYIKEAGDTPLSTYLRKKIQATDLLIDELKELKHLVQNQSLLAKSNNNYDESDSFSVLVELVLLLRAVSTPEKREAVHAEMNRLGIPVFECE